MATGDSTLGPFTSALNALEDGHYHSLWSTNRTGATPDPPSAREVPMPTPSSTQGNTCPNTPAVDAARTLASMGMGHRSARDSNAPQHHLSGGPMAGSSSGTLPPPSYPNPMPPPPPSYPELVKFCQDHGLTQDTFSVLLNNGFTEPSLLSLLDTNNIQQLPLPLAQRLLLTRVITQAPSIAPAGSATNPGTLPATTSGLDLTGLGDLLGLNSGQRNQNVTAVQDPRTYLQASSAGERYYDIIDFVPGILSREEKVSLPGADSRIELHIGTRKPKLETVTPHQWCAANARILYQLIKDKSLDLISMPEYLAYTVKISQLADMYEWVTVLLYDREYRRQQASLGHPWGVDNPHLYQVYLQHKQVKPAHASKHAGKPKPATRHDAAKQGPVDPGSGKEVCRNHNRGRCSWGVRCYRAHVCAMCFASDHTETHHSKN